MRLLIASVMLAVLGACASGPAQQRAESAVSSAELDASIAGAWRSDAERARDQYRHPAQSLAFWGLRPGMTIVEIQPGGGWWTRILAPYARQTGGRYIGALTDVVAMNVSDSVRQARANFNTNFSDQSIYGRVEVVDFGPRTGLALPDASADFILAAREFHNYARNNMTDRYIAEFARVLRPGGVLAVEQHRAPEGADAAQTARTGYVPEAYVIAAAQRAGLELTGRSEINANPRDTRNHPFGVWTLPPTSLTAPLGAPPDPTFDRAPFDAIGESDRMTLRFVKPS